MPSHLQRHDEAGHTHFWTLSCYRRLQFFHDDGMKQVAIEALRHLHGRLGICLIGYVIMPEHLHVLLYPHAPGDDRPIPIGRVLQIFKQTLGRLGKHRLRAVWRVHRKLWSAPLNRWANGEFDRQDIMQPRGYDRNVYSRNELIEKLDYCHKNPITRGLVDRAADWRWSSYRYYKLKDGSVLSMNWDGRWPIIW